MITLEQSHPSPDWQRMALLVGELVATHPVLQPLRDAGEIVHVESNLGEGALRHVVIQIEAPDWWVPRMETAEDRAHHLSRRLAIELRRAWERRSG